jgi:hypothetical protein
MPPKVTASYFLNRMTLQDARDIRNAIRRGKPIIGRAGGRLRASPDHMVHGLVSLLDRASSLNDPVPEYEPSLFPRQPVLIYHIIGLEQGA